MSDTGPIVAKIDGRDVTFKRSRKIITIDHAQPGADRTAFTTWANRALHDAADRLMKQTIAGISDDDYVYFANESPRTAERQAEIARNPRMTAHEIAERDRLVNGNWSLPEAPPVTTSAIDDPESEEYRTAAFKREWAEMIGMFNIAGSGSPMSSEAATALNARLHAHRMRISYTNLCTMDPAKVLEALAPKHILKPAKLPTGPFGPSVTAESEDDLKDMLAHLRADPVLSAKMRGAGYLVTSAERVKL